MTDPTIRAALEQIAETTAEKWIRDCGDLYGPEYADSSEEWATRFKDNNKLVCRILKAVMLGYQLGQQAERERCALLVAGHITDSCPKDCAACALARDMARQIINISLSNMTDAAWVAALRTPEEPAE